MRFFQYLLLLFIISCRDSTEIHEDYYFPVKDFFEEKTYCFVNQNDTAEKMIWKMKASVSGNDTILRTSIFESLNRIQETMVEKVSGGSSWAISYTMYNYDSLGNSSFVNCTIIDSAIYSNSQKNNEQIAWKVRFKHPWLTEPSEFSKTRTLIEQTPDQKVFSDQMKIEQVGTKKVYKFNFRAVYQKGKGLVAYKLFLPGEEKNFVLQSVN